MGQNASVPASRSSTNGHGTNNLPPLLFHNVCGENIRISREGTVARRAESFCKGIAFSSRPIKVNEKICIKFLEISNNWSGVIRFGFSYNDPSTLRDGLPKYACPDLTNKPGYWAKALPERFCNQGTVLFYYVSAAGDVHFGINNEEKGIFFSGVETRGPLWALIDVYGNSTAIEFVDIRHQLNNARRTTIQREIEANPPAPVDVDRIICSTQNMNLHHHSLNHQRESVSVECATTELQLRYQPAGSQFVPMSLHRTKGRNIRFSNGSRCEAARVENEFCQGYVFTSRPLNLNQPMLIQILSSAPLFQGCLGLGLTSCDPATLSPNDLPDDSSFLLDRPEYWVISRDFARSLNVGDEITFSVSERGEVAVRRNGSAEAAVVMHVDQTLKLWAVFDVYGGTRKIRVLTQQQPSQQVASTTPTRSGISQCIVTTPNSESMNSLNEQMMLRRSNSTQSNQPSQQQRLTFSSADIQVQPSANGGAVLSLILPPGHASIIHSPQQNQTVQMLPTSSLTTSCQQQQLVVSRQTSSHHQHLSNIQQYQQHNSNVVVATTNYGSSIASATPVSSSTSSSCASSGSAGLLAISNAVGNGLGVVVPPQQMSNCGSNNYIETIASNNTDNTNTNSNTCCQSPTATSLLSPPSYNTNKQLNNNNNNNNNNSSSPVSGVSQQTWVEQNGSSGTNAQYSAGAECTICYENSIDAVLYMCGHMCMCYECALQQWRGKGGGHCPLCRALIRDVIRTYKS